MDGLGPGLLGHLEDLLHLEVALRGRPRTKQVGLAGPPHMRGVAVGLGVDGHAGHAQLLERAHHADGDLAAVGYEDLVEHLRRVRLSASLGPVSRGRSVFLALAVAVSLTLPAGAQAAIDFRSCNGIGCGRLVVPLDRSGAVPGRVSLHVERRPARRRPRRGVTLLLAGGPGQPSTAAFRPYGEFAALTPRNDIVAFDPRGTGRSGLLRCPALERASLIDPGREAAACARRLGARRGFYRTSETVDDIEALRAELGVERLTLLGVSYGTLVAQAYAARYPQRVERVLLDSVLDVSGVDPLYRDIFGAVPRVLRATCRSGCRSFTADSVADLSRLVRRIATRGPLRGRLTLAGGRRRPAALTRQGLFFTLLAGDLDDLSRASFPGAVRAALRGDPAPILRLEQRAIRSEGSGTPRDFSTALYAATSCEEIPFPWTRFSDPVTRFAEIRAAFAQIPAGAFRPFDRATSAGNDFIRLCRRWPEASPAPAPGPPPGSLPDVPVLMLSGELDLRTPLETARGALGDWPRARLLVAPNYGHSVLSSFSACVATAVRRFFRGGRLPARCRGERPLFAPLPPPPTALRQLRSLAGVGGRDGRVVQAVRLTIVDVYEEFFSHLLLGPARRVRGGGLRGGSWSYAAGADRLRMDDVELVPGLRVSGTVLRFAGRRPRAVLRVSGPATPDGMLVLRNRRVSGRLGGRMVSGRFGRAARGECRRRAQRPEPGAADPPGAEAAAACARSPLKNAAIISGAIQSSTASGSSIRSSAIPLAIANVIVATCSAGMAGSMPSRSARRSSSSAILRRMPR